jgi:NAD+ diphosphatase
MISAPKLAAPAYDRATYRRDDPDWVAQAWERSQVLLVTPKSAAPVRREPNAAPQLAFRDPASIDLDGAPRRFLGLVDGVPYFAVRAERDDGDWVTLRELGPLADDVQAGLLTSAIALEQWHQRHTHCPLCGTPTVEAHAGWTRTCPKDGSEHFPRTDPAIITVIHDGGDRCLLGRNAAWPAGRYSTLAGFVEPGESLEAAVAREIHEEASVYVVDIAYVASQPWPFPASLMLGFCCRVEGDQLVRPDHVEMADARWFSRQEVQRAADRTDSGGDPDPDAVLQFISPQLSISRYLIDLWLARELPQR